MDFCFFSYFGECEKVSSRRAKKNQHSLHKLQTGLHSIWSTVGRDPHINCYHTRSDFKIIYKRVYSFKNESVLQHIAVFATLKKTSIFLYIFREIHQSGFCSARSATLFFRLFFFKFFLLFIR